ncbi:SDR family oxidoreductase [Pseudogemmobacter bohemicus]|uniref:SDR family oxidoreductase n=1 Tax=Pseudogemmobacter bohemicus TaxID=2250708 RepID=UPI000DD4371A|nr:SDR family oxidoreductase [Pseudogemmobacter bohemicus]
MSAKETPVAVITGAGSGIGRAVAIALNRAGWRCALLGRREAPLAETAAQSPHRDRMLTVTADLSQSGQVRDAFAQIVAQFGRIDFLFNNAGAFGGQARVENTTPDAWDAVIAINLNGAFYCAREAWRQMLVQEPKGGRILNNGSISAHVPRPQTISYAVSKHAVTGLTKALALEGREHGIAVGQIDIGNAATEMTADMSKGMLQADGSIRPEPVMDVSHVADMVLMIAQQPLAVNTLFTTIMATAMPYVGRG